MTDTKTLDYYNQHADDFIANTVDAAFSETQDKFLSKLEKGAYILDFGCGSGRDTKYFLEKGYKVDAMDGSAKLCAYASAYTGIRVRQALFQDLDARGVYDGIWACSSILHLRKSELTDVIRKMAAALKPGGVIYTSFKHGHFEGERNGRYFTDFTSEDFNEFLKKIDALSLEEQWITSDVRPGRGEEKWLNLILRRK